jgi:hypothetical protein
MQPVNPPVDTGNALIQLWTVAFQNLPALITALVSGLAWWSARKAAKAAESAEKKTTETGVKADTIIVKADEGLIKSEQIHTLTNSTLSISKEELKVAQETIKGQAELIKSMVESKRVADELSTKKVQQAEPLQQGASESPVPVADDAVLQQLQSDVTPKLNTVLETVDSLKKSSDSQDSTTVVPPPPTTREAQQ